MKNKILYLNQLCRLKSRKCFLVFFFLHVKIIITILKSDGTLFAEPRTTSSYLSQRPHTE